MTVYMNAHMRVRRARGAAKEFTCACGAPAREWAHIPSPREQVDPVSGMRYSNDVNDYRAMCKPCHQRFDKAAITHCPQGHPYAGENLIVDAGKRKCRTCVYARNRQRPKSPETKAKAADAQRRRRQAKKAAA